MTERYYVTLTWDDFPEGGSFGTIVEADGYDQAEDLARQQMAESRPELGDSVEEVSRQWHVVDCFPLDDFIERHQRVSA